jgi:hypothetical protein
MRASFSEFVCLSRATLRIYRSALIDATHGFLLNWRMLFVHLGCLFAFSFLTRLALFFGPYAGGFVLGLVVALVLSLYLYTVAAGVSREQLQFREAAQHGFELFGPTLSVLFAFFLLNITADLITRSPEVMWLRMVVNLLLAVLFNCVPEVIYQRPSGMGTMFAESFEFMRENFVEWFLPLLVLLLPLGVIKQGAVLTLGITLLTINPLEMIQSFMLWFSDPLLLVGYWWLTITLLFCAYFSFIFRGQLYRQLSSSTRRKRIYQERYR